MTSPSASPLATATRPAGGPPAAGERSLVAALVVMTFTTGLIEAVSYLSLGRVFTGFQTGNVVLLGFALGGADGFAVTAPAVSLVAFALGAVAGGRLSMRIGPHRRRWFGLSLAIEAVLLLAAAAAVTWLEPGAPVDPRLVAVAIVAVAMGVRTATVRHLAIPDLTTTVLTSTITGLAVDTGVAGGSTRRLVRRLAAVVAMLSGAVAGALLAQRSVGVSLLVVAALVAVTAVVYSAAAFLAGPRES